MAATRLIALHVNKGKTVAQCLADRTDYSQNAAKTNDGEFISSYECDPKTVDEEFLLSKRQYQHTTGRQQKNICQGCRTTRRQTSKHIESSIKCSHDKKHMATFFT